MPAQDAGHARVLFDESAWQEDVRNATEAARKIAAQTRARLERHDQPIDALLACSAEGPDNTRLPGCVKGLHPTPGGTLGSHLPDRQGRGRPTPPRPPRLRIAPPTHGTTRQRLPDRPPATARTSLNQAR